VFSGEPVRIVCGRWAGTAVPANGGHGDAQA
jgi:hypothetical protein